MVRTVLMAGLCLLFWALPIAAGENLDKAKAYYSDGEFKKAVKYAKKELKDDPNNIDASICLAESYSERGNAKKSISIYRELIEQDPENMDLVFRLGQVFNKAEYHRDAALTYEQILMKNPDDVTVRYWLGVSYALCMDLSKAYTEYRILKGKDKKLADDLLEYIQTNK